LKKFSFIFILSSFFLNASESPIGKGRNLGQNRYLPPLFRSPASSFDDSSVGGVSNSFVMIYPLVASRSAPTSPKHTRPTHTRHVSGSNRHLKKRQFRPVDSETDRLRRACGL
jgi:hypothetical protein